MLYAVDDAIKGDGIDKFRIKKLMKQSMTMKWSNKRYTTINCHPWWFYCYP